MKNIHRLILGSALVVSIGFQVPVVLAQTPSPTVTSSALDESTVASSPAEVREQDAEDYVLPYPGLLIDHPLYFLKRLRDTILENLITDPLRKSEFYILQADKHLAMGMKLQEQQKNTLASEVYLKGEEWMEKSVTGLTNVKQSGKLVPGHILDQLWKSSTRHIMVLDNAQSTMGEAEQSTIESARKKAHEIQANVPALAN